MNILLIYPKYPDTFWSFKHIMKFLSKRAALPPLGLLTVASMLPKKWSKKLIDMNVRKLSDKDIKWADMVLVSAMIVQKDSAQEAIDRCKALGKIVVAGGPAFTTGHENFRNIDHFVLNEAEVTLPMFLKDFADGKAKKIYSSNERPDITKTPLPSWELINKRHYATMCVQYSRGCPFNCEFCDIIIMNGRVPRTKTPDQMISEFQALYNSGWRGGVFVVDDNFIGNKESVKTLLKQVILWQKEHRYPFDLSTEASTNLADDDELMKLMSAANFSNVFLGIETTNLESLKECGKIQNTKRDLGDSVRAIQRNGMQVTGGFIVGFDSDNENIFQKQIKFIQDVGIVTAMVGILGALPQTRLWHRLKAEGRLLNETTGENTDGNLNFIPKMGKKQLIEGYKKLISKVYSIKQYYSRIQTFIDHYNPTAKVRMNMSHIHALFMSMWKIGIFSKARFLYWKLLIRTFFKKIKAFPIAVELAIKGLHFERITKKLVGKKSAA